MMGKLFRQVLDKLMVSPVAQNARVQVALPDGKFYDIKGIQLMENKLLGVRETHRLSRSYSRRLCVHCALDN